MKKLFFLYFFLLMGTSLWSQNLVREKWQYRLDDKVITHKEVKQLYKKVPQAHQYFKKAQTQLRISSGLILLGAAFTGERIGRLTATGEITWNKAGIGLGVLGLGIVSSIGLNKKYDKAVTIYNQQKSKKTSFTLKTSTRGLGVTIQF